MLSTRPDGATATLPDAPERILVIRLGALGDVVRTRFAFSGVRARYPEARIDWLVEDRSADGLCGIRDLDRVVQVPRRALRWGSPLRAARLLREVIHELRAERYELSLDFHSILKSALLASAARIPVRIGYGAPLAREGAARLLTHPVELDRTYLSRFERNEALVRFVGGEVPNTAPALALPSGAGASLGELPRDFAVIHPGTSRTTLYKRWELERFATVARELHRKHDVPALITWGPVRGEREMAEQIVAAAGEGARLAPATLEMAEILALFSRARLFIGCDSGPMHLAALAGLPLVVLLGPTDPVENAPFPGVPSRVVRRDVGCNPCREGCPARTCMAVLEPADVLAAAGELLAGPTA